MSIEALQTIIVQTDLFTVDKEVVVAEGEPTLLELVVSRLVVVRHLRDRGRCHLPKEPQSQTHTYAKNKSDGLGPCCHINSCLIRHNSLFGRNIDNMSACTVRSVN